MNKFLRKYSRVCLAGILGATLFSTANFVSATDDNVPYSFTIKANAANSYSFVRYRQTSNTNNQWKVQLVNSGEGPGTFTTFWMEAVLDSYWYLGAKPYDVQQGALATKRDAYAVASQTNVRLGAENNNYSSNTYTASGYWDEETN